MDQIIKIENAPTPQNIPLENSNEVLNMNYNQATNKPKINDVELVGNKTLDNLGIQPKGNYITEESDPAFKSDIIDHNTSTLSHEDIRSYLAVVEAIARGKSRGRAFDTVEDLDTWLEDEENVAELEIGDNLYVRDTEVPDYWWDGEGRLPLEGEKVDLSIFYTKDQSNERYVLTEAGKTLVSTLKQTAWDNKLDQVACDSSIAGNGTAGNPLSVAREQLTNYDEYLSRKTAGTLVANKLYYWGE